MFYFVSSFSLRGFKRLFVFPECGYFPQASLRSPSSGVPGCPIQYPDQHPLRNIDVTVRQEQNGQRGIASAQSFAVGSGISKILHVEQR